MNYSSYLNRDYKPHAAGDTKRPPRLHRKHLHLLAIFSVTAGLVALFSPSHDAEATRQITQQASPASGQVAREEILDLPLPLPQQLGKSRSEPRQPQDLPWKSVTVRSGDSLSLIFSRLELSPQQLHAVVEADEGGKLLTALRPGQKLHFQIEENTLQAIKYIISPERSLYVTRKGESFNSNVIEHPVEIRLTHASGGIDSSLYQSGSEAGLSDNIIMELANIFGWDVDFALDIRKGDQFALLFEEHYLDGDKLRDGKILAAEFTNRGNTYRAVLFTNAEGQSQYYSPEGKSMRKAFLRSPVDFHRISSKFTRERYHPVLGKKRPHRGVDYAAATGTPIKAAGDGKVIFRGVKGGYGRTVVLQHGGSITTLYAHLSNFRRGVGNGSRVKQGQVIGYVGQSGLATGPHLHYEFRINGAHRNPLTVKLPDAEPLPAKYREEFAQQSGQLLAQLDLFKRVQLAEAGEQ
ncbi:MAG: peptidoglycan DD-metalloendopeptidase family protein [Gammaproteobacteria bacterium]|nr:peptidoglycan DD-metalloendopeptidase family protein [Gammaproteobacteria bacterium]MCW8841141.1 peptidoglycan DD-metalloendopeptidase family protein [Gammaproteobacteria bacterium]MCW8927632.1 peptidoglycan DD-metalloendopeptidase family protein [Gammaproteobacteria bacterium]MCW8957634.1 peptidoglycan DD-metalloendopeptidase family protein [Gammaproteobacteria bacterium]MCW8973005.1 peptidoglycan DD-metalloendopeptidase family protein [Gammaproteobacteria bacterium]